MTPSIFEKGIAAFTGFFTAGPIGCVAAFYALKGLNGKWIPWVLLGLPASVLINVFYVIVLVTAGAVSTEAPQPVQKDAMIVPSTEMHL